MTVLTVLMGCLLVAVSGFFTFLVPSAVVATVFVLVLPGTSRWGRWQMLTAAGSLMGSVLFLLGFFLVFFAHEDIPIPELSGPVPLYVSLLLLAGIILVAQIIGLAVGAEKYFISDKRR